MAGFMPSGGEVGPGERSFNLGESELTLAASVDPYFSAAADRGDHGRGRDRSRGGVLPHDRAAFGLHGQGRPLLLRFRLPQRSARACLGLRGPAARLPGVLRRAALAGRRAGEVDRAHGPLPRTRRGDRQRRRVSRHAAGRQRAERHDAVRARRRRPRRQRELAPRRVVDRPRCRGPRVRGRGRRREAGRERVHRQVGNLGGGRRLQVGAGGNSALRYVKLQGEYMHRRESGDLAFDVDGRGARGRLSQHAVRLVRPGRLPVPAALARGPALRRARLRHGRHRARDVRRADRGRPSRRCSPAIRAARP